MRDAVLQDLNALPEIQTFCTHDPRLPTPVSAHESIAITDQETAWTQWGQYIAEVDAILPIAPETSGILLRLTELISNHHKVLLGCSAEGVKIASSKYQTFLALQAAGIEVVPTYKLDEYPANHYAKSVAKPDDGAGCEGSMVFTSAKELVVWRNANNENNYVVQPYLQGIPASLSTLCDRGNAWLLSCNRQQIEELSGRFIYKGSVINGAAEHWDLFERLAQQIAEAIPKLWGYVGVDVILHEHGISVLEINPRLTTSYAGLHQAMAYNPTKLLLDLLYNSGSSSVEFEMPTIQRNTVEVSIHG